VQATKALEQVLLLADADLQVSTPTVVDVSLHVHNSSGDMDKATCVSGAGLPHTIAHPHQTAERPLDSGIWARSVNMPTCPNVLIAASVSCMSLLGLMHLASAPAALYALTISLCRLHRVLGAAAGQK
jgi:hypothetical protein